MKSFQKETNASLSLAMRLLDVAMLVVSAIISFYIVFERFDLSEVYRLGLTLGVVTMSLTFHITNMYRAWRGSSRIKEFAVIFFTISFVFMILAALSVATKTSILFSRLWFGTWFLWSVLSVGGYRFILRILLSELRKRGYNQKRIAIIGEVDSISKVLTVLAESPWLGLRPVVFLQTDSNLAQSIFGLHERQDVSSILDDVKNDRVDEIWLALPIVKAKKLELLLNDLAVSPCPIRYVPDFFGFDLINHSITSIGRLPVVNLSVSPIGGWSGLLKWTEDKLLSAIILICISPVLLLLALGVKLTSPGPVFYKQERVSWNGKRFGMLKFRSMPIDVEKNGAQWGNAGSKTTTKFGAFIRKTSLDELPQFINVLIGDMSIVGPRPERSEFVEQFKDEIPRYMQKHMVKGGITGWAQINGWRGDTDLKSRIDADLYYIEKWSVWLDIKIVFLTAIKIFNDQSAK